MVRTRSVLVVLLLVLARQGLLRRASGFHHRLSLVREKALPKDIGSENVPMSRNIC